MDFLAQHPSISALVGAAGFYLLYYIYWELTVGASRRQMIRNNGCQPPFELPKPWWDRGHLGLQNAYKDSQISKENRLLSFGRSRFLGFGVNTFATWSLGHRVIITTEPENLKHIQAVQFKKFQFPIRRKVAFKAFLGHGIFNNDGAAWQHSRDMLRPNFTKSQVGDLDLYERHGQHLLKQIPRDGSTVNLQPLFFDLTMDSATEYLFGESTNTLVPGAMTTGAREFVNAFVRSQNGALDRARFGPFFAKLWSGQNYERDSEIVHAFLEGMVDRAFEGKHQRSEAAGGSKARYIFADELISQTSDRALIRGELLNVLLAGRDTTAGLLSNVWFELSKRPDIFAKLEAEVQSILPDGKNGPPPTYEQIKEMKYLRALLNESLRLYPVVPGNARQNIVDTTLPKGGGPDGQSPMFIPKDTTVGWSLYTMHRRKDYYGEDAEEFKPERWLGEKSLRPSWEYLPFNGGPRICLGRKFTMTRYISDRVRADRAQNNLRSPRRHTPRSSCSRSSKLSRAATRTRGLRASR